MSDMPREPGADAGQVKARAAALGQPPETLSAALGGKLVEVDGYVLALSVAVVRGKRRPAQTVTDAEAKTLAGAVLSLAQALVSVWQIDRTPPYPPGAHDRTGNAPPAGDAWLTPREIAAVALPFLADEKEPLNGQ